MIEKMKAVSNPLTIVGLFCGVAEVVSLFTIARIAPELQSIFIWFVMLFPVLIVLLFFGTLWLKDRVLYAPGDFKDEKNYLALVNAKQSLGIEKVRAMIAEAKTDIISEVMKTIPNNGEGDRNKVKEIVNEKLQPVQSFAGALRESSDYSLLSTVAAHTEKNEYYIWQLLHDEAKPMTLKEIASRLSLNEYAVSLMLYSLISRDIVKEHPDEGNGITYSSEHLSPKELSNWRSYIRKI